MLTSPDLSIPQFVPADRNKFADSYPQFSKTLTGDGSDLWRLLNRHEAFTHMASVTLVSDGPAVAGITKLVAPILLNADERSKAEGDLLRKTIGAMVCFVMTNNGFSKTETKRGVPPVRLEDSPKTPRRLFSKGEVYKRQRSST